MPIITEVCTFLCALSPLAPACGGSQAMDSLTVSSPSALCTGQRLLFILAGYRHEVCRKVGVLEREREKNIETGVGHLGFTLVLFVYCNLSDVNVNLQ